MLQHHLFQNPLKFSKIFTTGLLFLIYLLGCYRMKEYRKYIFCKRKSYYQISCLFWAITSLQLLMIHIVPLNIQKLNMHSWILSVTDCWEKYKSQCWSRRNGATHQRLSTGIGGEVSRTLITDLRNNPPSPHLTNPANVSGK